MPIYEYACKRCGQRFEELLSSSERESAVHCPQCDSRRVSRLLSAFAVAKTETAVAEPGPCGSCGAAQRGMCGVD